MVEDACQAQGAIVQGRPAGAWGDVGVWSFGGSKLLSAGRGGAIFTRHEDVYQRAKVFCERGNHAFPLSELQAAVLLPQLAKLDDYNERRRGSVRSIQQAISEFAEELAPSPIGKDDAPAYYKTSWLLGGQLAGDETRERFIAALRAEGLAMDAGFRGFDRRPASRCRKASQLEHAQQAAQRTVVLHHPVLLESPHVVELVGPAIAKVAESMLGE